MCAALVFVVAVALVGWKVFVGANLPEDLSSSKPLATGLGASVPTDAELASSGTLGHRQPGKLGTASTPRTVMPPADMPAVEVILRLESAANSGSVPASCRIAVELQDCAGRKNQLAAADAVQKSIQSTGASSSRLEDMAGSLLAASDRLEAKCFGIDDQQLATAFGYQMNAALASPDLARWLVANPALDRSIFMDHIEQWRSYKEFADQYLTLAVEQPSSENLPLLLSAYKPRNHPNIEILHREDPAMFLALVDIAQSGGAPIPSDLLMSAHAIRSSPSVVKAASQRRRALEDAGWGGVALDRSDFTPNPLRRPTIERCAQVP